LNEYVQVGRAQGHLPLAGWRTPALTLDNNAAGWLGAPWQQDTFALLAIAVTLGILARARGLAVITAGSMPPPPDWQAEPRLHPESSWGIPGMPTRPCCSPPLCC
jgi:hypothetical protein